MENHNFKLTLRAARINAGMRQIDAANKVGVSKDTIINWEKGKTIPNVLKLQKICEVYKCPQNIIFLKEE